jgi:glycerophosphoryl diester phosphodiesterase
MHRYPENSISGIKAAIDAGACMIEFDVQMTADQTFVLLHDDKFKRTAGVAGSVFDQSISASISIHEPDRFNDQFKSEPLPQLEQVLALVSANPQLTVFVEIKEESLKQWGVDHVMSKLIAALRPIQQQCAIISFVLDAVSYVKSQSKFRAGWVLHRYDEQHQMQAQQLSPQYLICNYKKVTDVLWPGSWQWMLYDIDKPELALMWANKGAALIETSDIGGMLKHPVLAECACYPEDD